MGRTEGVTSKLSYHGRKKKKRSPEPVQKMESHWRYLTLGHVARCRHSCFLESG